MSGVPGSPRLLMLNLNPRRWRKDRTMRSGPVLVLRTLLMIQLRFAFVKMSLTLASTTLGWGQVESCA